MSTSTTEETTGALPPALCAAVEARIQERSLELPLLPDAVSRVMTLTMQEDCDPRALAEAIHRDQAMAAHLLRLANSAIYAPKVPIVSLDQAVPRLGSRRIREITWIIACETRVFRAAGHEARMRAERRQALASALYGQEIARALRLSVEESFLGGLLHDSGRPVVLQLVLDLAGGLGIACGESLAEAAMDRWHARAGCALAEAWSLPPKVAMAALHHHDPAAAGGHTREAGIAALADGLARWTLGDGSGPPDPDGLGAALNLYPDDVEALAARREEVRRAVEGLG